MGFDRACRIRRSALVVLLLAHFCALLLLASGCSHRLSQSDSLRCACLMARREATVHEIAYCREHLQRAGDSNDARWIRECLLRCLSDSAACIDLSLSGYDPPTPLRLRAKLGPPRDPGGRLLWEHASDRGVSLYIPHGSSVFMLDPGVQCASGPFYDIVAANHALLLGKEYDLLVYPLGVRCQDPWGHTYAYVQIAR
jgi:hypothetical protein